MTVLDRVVETSRSSAPGGAVGGAVRRAGRLESALAGPTDAERGRRLGNHGHPRVVFDRALANGNLLLAEMTARELGWINLLDALDLLALLTVKDPRRGERAKARWLRRYLEADPAAGLRETATVIGCLDALAGSGHEQALALLRTFAERASRDRPPRAVLERELERRDKAAESSR